jgi:hypothetical protein
MSADYPAALFEKISYDAHKPTLKSFFKKQRNGSRESTEALYLQALACPNRAWDTPGTDDKLVNLKKVVGQWDKLGQHGK